MDDYEMKIKAKFSSISHFYLPEMGFCMFATGL